MKGRLIKISGIFTWVLIALSSNGQVWIGKDNTVRIFSQTPLEDIEGISHKAGAAINTQTGKVYFKVPIKSFKFKKALMEEHFNENYMESDKMPYAEFDGIMKNIPDFTKTADHTITLEGNLTMHGVSMPRTIDANISISPQKISGRSRFMVKCSDHKIDIPKIVLNNIAEELEVTVQIEMTPKS